MRIESGIAWELLSATERAVMRRVALEGGACTLSFKDLAAQIGRSELWVTLTIGRLRRRGWIETRRASRRRPSEIVLTTKGRELLQSGLPGSSEAPAAVAGFWGDVEQRKVARTAARIGRQGEVSNVDYAAHYLRDLNPAEVARIAALTDEWGGIPTDVQATGDERLDEGLRLIYARRAREAMGRSQTLGSMRLSSQLRRIADEE